jgi:mono/diheme cytochrome c family protein
MKLRPLLVAGGLAAAAWTGELDLLSRVPQASAAWPNPLENNRDAERAGAKLYARECAACHGPRREGRGRAPRLDCPAVHEAAPGELFWILRNGSLRNGMPSFAHLPETERWQIITFLRSSAASQAGSGRPSP